MKWKTWMGWGALGVGAGVTFICGVAGFVQAGESQVDALYGALQLFVLEYNKPGDPGLLLHFARFAAPALLAATAIRTFLLLLQEEIREWKLSRLKGHVIVCGLGRKGHELVRQCLKDFPVVIIERDENNDYLSTCRNAGAHILIGDCSDPSMLRRARADGASEIYLVTGCDGANFSTLVHLSELRPEKAAGAVSPKVWLHLNAVEMCAFLRNETILRRVREKIDFQVINLFEAAVRDLIIRHLIPLLPARADDQKRMHLVVVGSGRMGQTLIRKFLQGAVTANGLKPAITVISPTAGHDIDCLFGEIPGIPTCCDLEILDGDILWSKTRQTLLQKLRSDSAKNEIPAICLATGSQYTNISAALRLAEDLSSALLQNISLFVRQVESEGWSALADDLSQQADGAYRCIQGFGVLPDLCKRESLQQNRLNAMARAMHEAYLTANQPLRPNEKPSHRPWSELPWELQQSNRHAVDHLRVKLRTLGFDWSDASDAVPVPFNPSDGELKELAVLEHRRWEIEKILFNWSFDQQTDYGRKMHDCMVDWQNLSDEEKQKDFDQINAFAQILHAGHYVVIQGNSGHE